MDDDELEFDKQAAQKEDSEKQLTSLKASLLYDITKLTEAQCQAQGLSFTKDLLVSLTETVWEACTNLAYDLDAFSKHAGRRSIKPEDVLLAARRNEVLHMRIQAVAEEIKEAAQKRKSKKRKQPDETTNNTNNQFDADTSKPASKRQKNEEIELDPNELALDEDDFDYHH